MVVAGERKRDRTARGLLAESVRRGGHASMLFGLLIGGIVWLSFVVRLYFEPSRYTATVVLEDVEHADLVFVIGGNPASNHPRLMRSIIDMKRRGGRVIVINPVREGEQFGCDE